MLHFRLSEGTWKAVSLPLDYLTALIKYFIWQSVNFTAPHSTTIGATTTNCKIILWSYSLMLPIIYSSISKSITHLLLSKLLWQYGACIAHDLIKRFISSFTNYQIQLIQAKCNRGFQRRVHQSVRLSIVWSSLQLWRNNMLPLRNEKGNLSFLRLNDSTFRIMSSLTNFRTRV
jgi:hypothetical protein